MIEDEDDDEDKFVSNKFDDCKSCKNRFNFSICRDCGYGEDFEEEDIDEVDKFFDGRI